MLEHLKECIKGKKEASIVYLGGSITEGQGVADKRLCWQGLLQSFMERRWPECRFSAVNAGIRGTDSGFGAFRMERDVLPHRPDLLLVEFAVNDYMREPEDIEASLEGILYKLWKSCPEAEVILVLTVTGKMAQENYGKGKLPESVAVHSKVAQRCKLPCANVGEMLLKHCREEKKELQLFLPDTVHPNREGYRMYYRFLKEQLFQWLEEAGQIEEKRIPGKNPAAEQNPYFRCRMVPAAQAVLKGFVQENIAMCGRFGAYVSSFRKGDSLTFSFTGDKIGLFYMVSSDGGTMEWSLDEGEWSTLSAWDTYTRQFDRGSAKMLAEHLAFGNHVLCIRNSGKKMPESKGSFLRIADFLI